MKEMIVVGGANGTGKTTFSLAYARQRLIPYLGADTIAQEISPDAPASVSVAAGTDQTIFVRDEQRFAMFQAWTGVERNG